MLEIKNAKVIDCQDMPDDVQSAFYFFEGSEGRGNDIYVSWSIEDITNSDDECNKSKNIVNSWLTENGLNKGDFILINHWW